MQVVDVTGRREVMRGQAPILRGRMTRDEPMEANDFLVAVLTAQPRLKELLHERVVTTTTAVGVRAAAEEAEALGLGDVPAAFHVVDLADDRGQLRVDRLQ